MKKQIYAILAAAMMLSAFTGCQKRQDSSPASETIPTSAEDTAEHSGTLLADFPVADDDLALVLMPGLAIDADGHRIGYGGGFYDRYLAAHHDHKLVGHRRQPLL